MKGLIIGFVALIGIAIYQDQKAWNKFGEKVSEANRKDLTALLSKENLGHLVEKFTDNEVSVVYSVLTMFNHPSEAPKELHDRFYKIAEKYNIFI